MKKILGLDLGTNSIGWALVDNDEKKILGMGSRMDSKINPTDVRGVQQGITLDSSAYSLVVICLSFAKIIFF